MLNYDILGYIAMAIILLAILMDDLRHFRILNSIACFMFIFYSYHHGTWPVLYLNCAIVIINIYQLNKSRIYSLILWLKTHFKQPNRQPIPFSPIEEYDNSIAVTIMISMVIAGILSGALLFIAYNISGLFL